jgi:hypothetical protein
MCAIQRNNNQQRGYGRQDHNPQENNQTQQQPNQKQQHYRFRWPVYVGIPLAVLIFLWFVNGIEFAYRFSDITRSLGIIFTDRFMLLACLGILSVTALLIIKAYRK